jgi:predicted Fe-S protein YdhL (DUF1289 family)
MASIETPCISICTLDPALGLCVGCGRALDEIARWISLTDSERAQIMAQLPSRRAAMSTADTASVKTAPATAVATPSASA